MPKHQPVLCRTGIRFTDLQGTMSSSFSDSVELGEDDGYQLFHPSYADTSSPPPIYGPNSGLWSDPAGVSSFTQEVDGKAFNAGYVASDGPILPPPVEMGRDEGVAVREWRRENAIRLEEKEKREKELLRQIIAEAEDYKFDFHRRREVNCETNKVVNREKEKLFVASQEKFCAEADKNYWKAIAELIPNEVPTIEKKRGKKEDEKTPSISVVQGPKPGKPTELSRMRHILLKLKHNTPPHLELSAPPAPAEGAETGGSATVSAPPAKAMVATPLEAAA